MAVPSMLVVASLIWSAPLALGTPEVQGQIPGDGWTLLRFDHRGETFINLSARYVDGAMVGAHILNMEGVHVAGLLASSTQDGTFVSVDTGEGEPLVEERIDTSLPFSGEWRLDPQMGLVGGELDGYTLIWGAGELAWLDWRVHAHGTGASAYVIATGSGSFYSEGSDFDSDQHVIVHDYSTRVVLQEGGRLAFAPQENFFGIVGSASNLFTQGEQTIILETPVGSRTCGCPLMSFSGPNAAPAGTYVIHRDAERIETRSNTLILAGVDVPWPPT